MNSTAGGCTQRVWLHLLFALQLKKIMENLSQGSQLLTWEHLNWPTALGQHKSLQCCQHKLLYQLSIKNQCSDMVVENGTSKCLTFPATNVPDTMRCHLDLGTCSFRTSSHSDTEPIMHHWINELLKYPVLPCKYPLK